MLRAECRQIKAERRELVADLRQYFAGQQVAPNTVDQCIQQLRSNMQDEVSALQTCRLQQHVLCMLGGWKHRASPARRRIARCR